MTAIHIACSECEKPLRATVEFGEGGQLFYVLPCGFCQPQAVKERGD